VLDQPTASSLSGSSVKDLSITPGIRLPLETGGELAVNLPLNRLETNNTFSTLNPAYSSDFQVQFSQPLLRGAGFETNAQRIRIAFYEYQAAEARTKLSVINVLATAERVYWRLYAARKELEVRRKEYDLAVALLEQARRRAGGGVAAEVDVIRAESGVADKLESIILAENQLRDRQRDLKRILNRPDLGMDSPVEIVPRTNPDGAYYQLDPNQLVASALKQRMEMIELAIRLAREAQNVDVARTDLLPLLSLTYTYNINGLGRDFSDSLSQTFDRDFQDHIIGLQFEIPIGNEGARSRLRRAIAQRVQTLASQEQRIAQIKQEVYKSVDDLEANWQRILAATQRVALAARTLDAENRQFIQGLRTSTDVLNAQANLANAESSLISAITQYQISQIDVAFATGTVLGASNVIWEPMRGGLTK
jgi:outer membrane protein TolC